MFSNKKTGQHWWNISGRRTIALEEYTWISFGKDVCMCVSERGIKDMARKPQIEFEQWNMACEKRSKVFFLAEYGSRSLIIWTSQFHYFFVEVGFYTFFVNTQDWVTIICREQHLTSSCSSGEWMMEMGNQLRSSR